MEVGRRLHGPNRGLLVSVHYMAPCDPEPEVVFEMLGLEPTASGLLGSP